jgi:hypothetical protein
LRSPELCGASADRIIELIEEVEPNRKQVFVLSSPARCRLFRTA